MMTVGSLIFLSLGSLLLLASLLLFVLSTELAAEARRLSAAQRRESRMEEKMFLDEEVRSKV